MYDYLLCYINLFLYACICFYLNHEQKNKVFVHVPNNCIHILVHISDIVLLNLPDQKNNIKAQIVINVPGL